MVATNLAATFLVPADASMGDAQRIVYVHVSLAWISIAGFIVMAATGVQYLRQRDLRWDHWSHAAAELGWLSCGLTLLTGSLWAHEAWGTWWTWDPRLTTAFLLWMAYSACLTLRGSLKDEHRRAQICAVLAAVGLVDVPFVVMATRWFRGIHPVSAEMDPSMKIVLCMSVVAYTTFFALLLIERQRQLRLASVLSDLTHRSSTIAGYPGRPDGIRLSQGLSK